MSCMCLCVSIDTCRVGYIWMNEHAYVCELCMYVCLQFVRDTFIKLNESGCVCMFVYMFISSYVCV